MWPAVTLLLAIDAAQLLIAATLTNKRSVLSNVGYFFELAVCKTLVGDTAFSAYILIVKLVKTVHPALRTRGARPHDVAQW